MKKTFLLFLLCNILFIFNTLAQEISYSNLRNGNGISVIFELKSYHINSLNYRGEAMHEIALSGIFIPNDEGMPNLPRISKFVAIPQGAEVRVSIKNMETERHENINIAPALKIQAIREEPVADYKKNEKLYSTNNFYPQIPFEVSEVTSLRGVNAIVIGITPFQFNPVTKELIVIHNMELEIEYIGGSTEYDDPKYRSPWFDPILKNVLLNYEALPEVEYKGKSSRDGEGCEYLIIIPNRDDFEPYAEQIKEFRTKQGIYTKIMRLDEMGVTTVNQLKTYIHNAYNEWNIPPVAVLLMGDHSTNFSLGIPAETVPHPYSGTCITDNQYADPTGDLLPDMVFGRMAAETEAQMAVLVSKFLEYETQPCMAPDYYQNPITALGWQTDRWFQICIEAVKGYWSQHAKTPHKISRISTGSSVPSDIWSSAPNTEEIVNYLGPDGLGYIPATPVECGGWTGGTADDVVSAVNAGAFTLLHRDHGNYAGWGDPNFTIPNISQLTNVGKMTYLFTINCETGKFNNFTPCFGEVFHRYTYQGGNAGCVGYLGPTDITYSYVNDAFIFGMFDFYQPDFLPDFGPSYGPENGVYSGYSGNWMPAFGNVAGKYFLHQSSWPYNEDDKDITYQMFTAHSDVFLRVFTEVPQMLTVNHAEATLAGSSSFYVEADEGALIALTAEIDGTLEILDVAIATGEMQELILPTTLIPSMEINVVCTKQNYLRHESTVLVVPAEGPYVVPIGYSLVDEDVLTYISENTEIVFTLKNVGSDPTQGPVTATITCDDSQLIINNGTAQIANVLNVNETAIANFIISIAHNIPNNKIFTVTITVTTDNDELWESKLSLKAYAPKFLLEKVLVNDIENENLEQGAIASITVIVTNKGGADAYGVRGNIETNDEYITVACNEPDYSTQDLLVGETMNLHYVILTKPLMPAGHIASLNFLGEAQYNLSFSLPFKISALDYCVPGATDCGTYTKFRSVQLCKTSDQSVLINNTDPSCSLDGYQNYTNLNATLEAGEQYTIKIKAVKDTRIRGWFDLNGNSIFDANEQLISFTCNSNSQEVSQTFTLPQNAIPGLHRFRLRIQYGGEPEACNGYSLGQTHDYSFTIPEIYPRVQNVVAVLNGANISVSWDAPEEIPIGFNIYRNDKCLNTTPLTNSAFTEENISEGIYVYYVTAVYAGNNESVPVASNIICYGYTQPQLCEKPLHPAGISQENTAVICWNKPKYMDGTLLGYNIYRDGIKIAETERSFVEYRDENLADGTYMYQVSAVYEHCEESELTEEISVTILTDAINDVQTSSFNIYPNPANGNVTIEGAGLNHIEIYDVYGRNVSSHHLIVSSSHHLINISYLQSGIYFVKIYSETNQIVVKRLVVI